MNVITGEVAPTHGCAYVSGLDVSTDISKCQQIVGVCAQDDLLWGEVCLIYLPTFYKGTFITYLMVIYILARVLVNCAGTHDAYCRLQGVGVWLCAGPGGRGCAAESGAAGSS